MTLKEASKRLEKLEARQAMRVPLPIRLLDDIPGLALSKLSPADRKRIETCQATPEGEWTKDQRRAWSKFHEAQAEVGREPGIWMSEADVGLLR